MFLLSQDVAVSSDVIVSRKYPKIFRWDQKKCAQRTNAAQAAPTEIAQARPSSFMDAVCVTFTPASRQEASSGSVSAGSASSARITSSARPSRSAFFTCLMPTTLDGDKISLPPLQFHAISTPGHTKGSSCFVCGNTIFSGDTLFEGCCGRTDLPGGSEKQMMASLKRLAELPGDYQVLPGHGPSSTLERERQTNFYMREAMR